MMNLMNESLQDLFFHFPGLVGIFDAKTTGLIWGNESWMKTYPARADDPQRGLQYFLQSIHKEDRPVFTQAFTNVVSGITEAVSFFTRFVNYDTRPDWYLCTFKRLNNRDGGNDWICCHQSDLANMATFDHFSEFYHDFRKRHPVSAMKKLTRREQEILRLIARGFSYTEIAQCLFIQPETVNKHRKNIQKKLHLNSIALLSCFAIENGLVE